MRRSWMRQCVLLLMLALSFGANDSMNHADDEGGVLKPLSWPRRIVYASLAFICVLWAGFCSGNTLGMLSLDQRELDILAEAGTSREKRQARVIRPLIRNHHLLLVTLLLSNALAMEMLPLFLNALVNEIVAVLLSVTAVLIFGEVLPQALCSRFGMTLGYYSSPIVFVTMILLYPIAMPIAKVLDLLFGTSHVDFYRPNQLAQLIHSHSQSEHGGPLTNEEVNTLESTLSLRDVPINELMTPFYRCFMLSFDTILDRAAIKRIYESGHSRIPVYKGERQNICGLLLVKTLIMIDADDRIALKDLGLRPIPKYSRELSAWQLLDKFQVGTSHLALVVDTPLINNDSLGETKQVESIIGVGNETTDENSTLVDHRVDPKSKTYTGGVLGIVTLEDIIEELIGEEIIDETDTDRRMNFIRARRIKRSDR